MPKYKFEIIMAEKHCVLCPLSKPDDDCPLQDGHFNSYEEQVVGCPLAEVVEPTLN